MKFNAIKAKAKMLFNTAIDNWPSGSLHKDFSPAVFQSLMPFVNATDKEREEMREFSDAFEAKKGDWVGMAAKSQQSKKLDVAWIQVILRAREAGLQRIDRWDVRAVGRLIQIFPDSVPANYRGKQLTCYMSDTEDGGWIVEVNEHQTQEEAS